MVPPYDTRLLREKHRSPTDLERSTAVFAKAARKERRRTVFIFIQLRMLWFLGRAIGIASKLRIRVKT